MAPGPTQLLIIALIVLLLFGATRLSEIGKGLGEGIRNFKKGLQDDPNDGAGSSADSKQLPAQDTAGTEVREGQREKV